MNILTIFVFMIFGFNVVSLYYIMKMYNIVQFYAFNETNSVFHKQHDLKRVDIFGLMGRLSSPSLFSQLSQVGHALLEKDKNLKVTFGYSLHGKNKHLNYAEIQTENTTVWITVEQENFADDNVCLFKIKIRSAGEEQTEFFTHETYYIDCVGETLETFDWLKIKKVEQKVS